MGISPFHKKHVWIIPAYALLYLLGFWFVEQRDVAPHIINISLDNYIPFCEYFVIPYFMWFVFLTAVLFYFSFINRSTKEFYALTLSLGFGMTLFLIVSFVYPNGHTLRPDLTGNTFCIQLVKFLYMIDTPTNILPSIHVFNTVACCVALTHNTWVKNRRPLYFVVLLSTLLIVLSTLLIKQHTLIDVFLALALNLVCYFLFYKHVFSSKS